MSGSQRRVGKQRVRIIGGRWRGRKLDFEPLEGLRPTGDRVKETLFNWLAPHIMGARCIDLFAGTGALGLEALSRGAVHCTFVDTSRAVTKRINDQLLRLGATDQGSCHQATAKQFLENTSERYDIVFIDPPFRLNLSTEVCAALTGQMSRNGVVYIETDARRSPPAMPSDWIQLREKVAGSVLFQLYQNTAAIG
ncbi:MAG: 16S rRNA (guanine(966)-N(2))-methyltransferase RsmD [Halioglobus sp.]|nr:16S rRNA (guanine(966)-N(2))-methyltransferase RsmD [Halioglobus sp.]